MKGLTLLHTASSHIPRFAALAAEFAPDVLVTHAVHEELLERARLRGGGDQAVTSELKGVLRVLAHDADVILCTCSTLGAAAERFDRYLGVRVLRVDRPLAHAAVARGKRIAVVVALASTLAPTRALLEEEALRAGQEGELRTIHVPAAWAHFERGDEQRYHRLIAEAADEAAERADVIVLAQASMAGSERYVSTQKPVLSSPRMGLAAALAALSRTPETVWSG